MLRLLAVILLTTAFAGCTEQGRYPVTNAECSETDAVQDLDQADCVSLPGGAGTF